MAFHEFMLKLQMQYTKLKVFERDHKTISIKIWGELSGRQLSGGLLGWELSGGIIQGVFL